MKKLTRLILLTATLFCSILSANTNYVWLGGADTPPYSNWANAAHTIQDAVNAAAPGDMVLVTNGIYYLTSQIIVSNNLTVKSVNGMAVTVVNGQSTCRGFYLDGNAVVEGFSVTNGQAVNGGGVFCAGQSTVLDCSLIGNRGDNGGAIYFQEAGKLIGGNIMANKVHIDGCGGGVYCDQGGVVENCMLDDNYAGQAGAKGGNVYMYQGGVVSNCTIKNGTGTGGGAYCVSGGLLENCLITGNLSGGYAGGIHADSTTLRSCAIVNNNSYGHVGGIRCANGTVLENCTIAGNNTTGNMGGGQFNAGVILLNTIIYTNTAGGSYPEYRIYAGATNEYCCAPRFTGSGNISNNPQFADSTYYRLQKSSPCINSGTNQAWMIGATDLDGNPRVDGNTVDMGAYEVKTPVHYVSYNGSAVPPYTNWATAATNIQDAVDVASAGETVLVTNGVYDTGETVTPGYSSSNRVVITNNIIVKSVNGPANTIILGKGPLGSNAVRGVYMSAGILSGFTISNGHTWIYPSGEDYYDKSGGGVNMYGGNGIIKNCIISGNLAQFYGGGTFGGTVNNCTIIGNSVYYGGGTCFSVVNNSTIIENSANLGGGTCLGIVNNSSISRNSASEDGGGTYQCTVNNSTISGNLANLGGGTANGTVNNSIIWDNSALSGNNYYDCVISYSCSFPLPSGEGNFTNNPVLLSASHISPSSPCAGAGTNAYSTGTDIDGEPWKNPPSVGCDELYLTDFTGDLYVDIYAEYTSAVVNAELDFISIIDGKPSSNCWAFGDGDSVANKYIASHSFAGAGDFEVILTAFNFDNPLGVSATVMVNIVDYDSSTYYVNKANTTPAYPYNGWSTAATNIQDAVDVASQIKNSLVLVTNGIYDTGETVTPGYFSSNRVVITKSIIVKSVNGPENTIILGKGPIGNAAVRGVYMEAGFLDGFTISNGHTMISSYNNYDQHGGGVNMFGGNGMITNCTISGNTTDEEGGGTYYGTVNDCKINGNLAYHGGGTYGGAINNCKINGNSADEKGGGTYEGTVNNCTISGNSAGARGGGTYYGTVNNCTISGNSGSDAGGGTCDGTINNCTISGNTAGFGSGSAWSTVNKCTISGNSADSGGGTYYGTVNDSTISGNSAGVSGGGTYYSTVNDSTISGNSAGSGGGGAFYGTVNNCTISGNSAGDYGGGTCLGTVNNCTISGNSADQGGGGTYQNTVNNCTISGNSGNLGGGTYQGTANNCIVWDNTASVASNNFYWCAISYSCSSPLPPGAGNISGNPQFVSVSDFHLQEISPCINAGTNALAAMPVDLDGNPRIIQNRVDMGAFEFVPIGYGYPFICITTMPETVAYNISTFQVSGTCNLHLAQIMWTNQLNGDNGIASAFSPGDTSWTTPIIPLGHGDNIISVSGTNFAGYLTNNVVCIHRKTVIESQPKISTNALIFPAANSVIHASMFTNITWNTEKITDDTDGTNLTITKIDLHYADTTNFILEVTNNIANTLGKIEWAVPPDTWSGEINYVLKFEVVDSLSLTNSRIFWDNKFVIVPEGGILWIIGLLVPLIKGGARKGGGF